MRFIDGIYIITGSYIDDKLSSFCIHSNVTGALQSIAEMEDGDVVFSKEYLVPDTIQAKVKDVLKKYHGTTPPAELEYHQGG